MFQIKKNFNTGLDIDNPGIEQVKEDDLFYMQDTVDNIKEFNIKDFNYIVFEEDLDNMYKPEFNKFFSDSIVPMLDSINEYLAIDIQEVQNESYRVKHTFVKNIVRFLMNTLPYIYMKEYLGSNGIEGFHDALDAFDVDVKNNIMNQIDKSRTQYESFNNMMGDIEDTITNEKKRNKFNDALSLLESSMDNKTKLLEYYKSIIDNSGEEGIQRLFKIYLMKDMDNII